MHKLSDVVSEHRQALKKLASGGTLEKRQAEVVVRRTFNEMVKIVLDGVPEESWDEDDWNAYRWLVEN